MIRSPIAPALFQRRIFGGNPPAHPYYYGWIIRLGGPASKAEKAWLKAHGYVHVSGWIIRLGGPASKAEKAWLKAHGEGPTWEDAFANAEIREMKGMPPLRLGFL